MHQSVNGNGMTPKKRPPSCTIAIWPAKIIAATDVNPRQPLRLKAELPVANALTLNMFQNCMKTKIVKNTESS